MLRARDRFDGVAKFTLESLTNQLADMAPAQPPPSPLAGVALGPGRGKQRIAVAPQRNLLADFQSAEGTGQLQQQQPQQLLQLQEQQQQRRQKQKQRAFSGIQGMDSVFADSGSSLGNPPYSEQSQFSSQQTDTPDRSSLSQPLVIPIIRQSPTPTSETPTPLNPNPLYVQQSNEWPLFGNSSEVSSSLQLLQQQTEEGLDLSFITDMDWASPELSRYTLDGLGGITGGLFFDSGSTNRGNATGSGAETEDDRMWGMDGSSLGR